MDDRSEITEEYFGILTDDGLALDATLLGQAGISDKEVKTIKVWVPKYPLTRSSVITAARRALNIWDKRGIVSLVYDHRGTGESEGLPDVDGLKIDLNSILEWAKERFGSSIKVEYLGFPEMGAAAGLLTLPIRPGVIAEFYRYDPPGKRKGVVLYFSQYFMFDRDDDKLAMELATGGFTVYGGDLMRYLLLAAPLDPDVMAKDTSTMIEPLGKPLYIIARAMAAGPALMMATLVPKVDGVIVTGPAQEGFSSGYIFNRYNPANFLISRAIKNLAPRPAVFLWNRSEAGEHSPDDLKNIHDQMEKPRLWGIIPKVSGSVMLNALNWLVQNKE
ncbi:MAG: hypothetical protein JXA42_19610 [Anaerolineales bacterium]|nr:hypothetical protein [Anaerolineales bacterium]